MVYHTDLFSGHLNPWRLTVQWYSEPLVFSIINSLEKLCVIMVKHPSSSNCLTFSHVGCWNVGSLVEMDGGIKSAIVQPKGHPVQIDRKIKFLVQELKRFHMSIVCISEIKWFGDDVYEVDRFTVLHLGCSIFQSGDAVQHFEGLAIVATSWMDSGATWSAISSRIVSGHLQLCLSNTNKLNITIVSVYALTHRAPVEMKDQFFDNLEAVISSTPPYDLLVFCSANVGLIID